MNHWKPTDRMGSKLDNLIVVVLFLFCSLGLAPFFVKASSSLVTAAMADYTSAHNNYKRKKKSSLQTLSQKNETAFPALT